MRNVKLFDYQGQKLSLKEIAQLNEVNYHMLANKYRLTGDINEAVEILKAVQVGPRKYVDFFGQKMTLNQIAKIYGLHRDTLSYFYKLTSNIDEAISFCVNNNFAAEEICEEKIKMQNNTVSIDKFKKLDKNSFPVTSLKGNDHTLLNNSIDVINMAENSMLTADINKAMNKSLSPRERKILCYRYGFSDGCAHTFRDTGKLFGLCGNRIAVIESVALRKLRRNPKYEHLVDYVCEK